MLRWGLALIVLLGSVFGLALGAMNSEAVTLDLGIVRWTASLGAVVAATGGLGLLFGLLLGAVAVGSGRRRPSRATSAHDPHPTPSSND